MAPFRFASAKVEHFFYSAKNIVLFFSFFARFFDFLQIFAVLFT
jgi:hypothetical protein